jgi:hypothetical protein
VAGTADDGHTNHRTTVSFGRGLNTSVPPGNPVNHAVLPRDIKIKAGGVADFAVAVSITS